jgi:hypothetical protein
LRKKIVNDKMQRGYRYELTAPAGRNFDPEFKPELIPMLKLTDRRRPSRGVRRS